jgi:hypothetical protein
MPSTIVTSVFALLLIGVAIAYAWPRAEARFERLFVSTLGALFGSLVGRLISDPRWAGHLVYVATGAFVFAAVDWLYRKHRSARND